MVVRSLRLLAASLALAASLGNFPLLAESTEEAPAKPQTVNVLAILSMDEGVGDIEAFRLSLEAALLSESGVGGVARRDVSTEGPIAEGRRTGCRIVLELGLKPVGDDRLAAEWDFVDVESGKKSAIHSFEKDRPAPAVLASAFWTEVLVDLEALLAEPRPSPSLELHAPPGTLFDGAGPRRTVPADGRLLIDFDVPLDLEWTATFPGEYPQHGFLRLEGGTKRLVVDRRRLAIVLGLVNFAYPRPMLEVEIDRGFSARMGLGQYLGGLRLASASAGKPVSFISSIPLLEPSVGASYSPFPPATGFRPYLALDVFPRIGLHPDWSPYIDPVAPFGAGLRIGFSWGLSGTLRFAFELGADLYPWTDPVAFVASGGSDGGRSLLAGAALFPGHPGWAVELPVGFAGIRMGL